MASIALEIPRGAWRRPIGLPLENPGRSLPEPHVSIDDGYWQGVPLGGIGAGTIGRTYRGDFARWHLDPGRHRYEPLPACMFSIFVEDQSGRLSQALWTEAPSRELAAWPWRYPVGAGFYAALYPRSWFVYEWERLPVRLAVEQFSPVIPHNYRESSYPVAVFLWFIENPTSEPLRVGILFTWQNLLGFGWDHRVPGGGIHRSRAEALASGRMIGVEMMGGEGPAQEPWDGSWALAALEVPGVEVTYRTWFPAEGDGAEIWEDFAADGRLESDAGAISPPEGERAGAGLAATFRLAPGEKRVVPMALAWDLPIVEFGAGDRWYRRHTVFFGRSGRNAWEIVREALERYPAWREGIQAWQRPILSDPTVPDWYLTALFNELYFIADGATAWVVDPADPEGIGRFAQIECYDYPFYETLDVRFYGSFPLLMLWPELEKAVMRDFIATVPQADLTLRTIEANGGQAPRKLPGALPHDLGSPLEAPWRMPNAYRFQDPNIWKDLNSKFVLLLYRDYVFTGDRELVESGWPAVRMALEYLKLFDRDADGLPENEGLPDQTYDTWPMRGPSAYCGGLWLAALEAAIRMADLVGDPEARSRYEDWLRRARESFEALLWNGQYYRYDALSPHRDSIMADQLAGQWYADLTGLPPIVPEPHILQAFRTIYDYNVRRFAEGRRGAVNGMRPDGTVDRCSNQSAEVWVGVTYALASAMLARGMEEEAWRTAWGAYHVTYEEKGYWFRTPEAWDERGDFRASMYLRPGAIWAIEWVRRR
ncbi:MAG: non-lysosomal glucosylceramidase [Thermoflexus sp.]|uniref:non-lysosomal glucosylceramidase n=2 Tax=Thermoflexus sp. TaxID=1969742 RepID=UPI0025E55473|nr:non-lysosomal glucosylceramidase [Thermoflexus sp.]MCS6962477.1 non-lysosomal glucosylceramidase [Thermoflexus sp.]MDW8183645.1 non-lysosomal glucosylceramidase [Anaerolineae bacterium]